MTKRRPKVPANGDFELRHWQQTRRKPKHRPSDIKIPNGDYGGHEFDEFEESEEDGEGGYVSLRDILSSPRYTVASPMGGGSCTEINMSNPLVIRAAYLYLQPTPSTREIAVRRPLDLRRICLDIFSPCFEFLGGIFNFRQ